MTQRKEVFLKNYRAAVNPEREGMLAQACMLHNVRLETVEGNHYLVLTDESLLDDLYQNLSFALSFEDGAEEDGPTLLREELSHLEVQ
jgi:hypothetical protein